MAVCRRCPLGVGLLPLGVLLCCVVRCVTDAGDVESARCRVRCLAHLKHVSGGTFDLYLWCTLGRTRYHNWQYSSWLQWHNYCMADDCVEAMTGKSHESPFLTICSLYRESTWFAAQSASHEMLRPLFIVRLTSELYNEIQWALIIVGRIQYTAHL